MRNILILLMLFTSLVVKSQVDVTINPFNSDINGTLQIRVVDRFYAGLTFDASLDGSTSLMVDCRYLIFNIDKKIDLDFYNGYSIGVDDMGFATAYYFTEQIYFNDFPIGISLYQRAYMSMDRGVYFDPRIGIVWKWRKDG